MTSVPYPTCGPGDPAPKQNAEYWLGPNGHTLLSWEVDFRTGGVARLCLRSPEGSDRWVEGVRLEIVEPERVVFRCNGAFADLSEPKATVTFRRE